MCVCVRNCKSSTEIRKEDKISFAKRGRFFNPLQHSYLFRLGSECVGTAGRGTGGETVNQ